MKTLKFFILTLVTMALCVNVSFAQMGSDDAAEDDTPNNKPLVQDGLYKKIAVEEKHVLEYDHIREADVMWQKRVWRVIDTREKLNLPFAYPEEPLIGIFMDLVNSGEVTVYTDEDFTTAFTKEDLASKVGGADSVLTFDFDTGAEIWKVVSNDFNPEEVQQFRLKEDWVFDEESSSMIVRIIGIAPIRDIYDDNGNFRGQNALFWVYYPEMRRYLTNFEAFNPFNDAQRSSWEDIFEMREFSSYIIKESNARDLRIQDTYSGVDALLESERVKNEIFLYEHDLWSY